MATQAPASTIFRRPKETSGWMSWLPKKLFLKCHSETKSKNLHLRVGDSSLPMVAQSDFLRWFCDQI